jgi:hypothetical protein
LLKPLRSLRFNGVCLTTGTPFDDNIDGFKTKKENISMKKQNVFMLAILAIGALLTGCAKEPLANMTEEESRIYITNYDSTANFKSYNTFALSDSVTVINNGSASRQQTSTDLAFINAVKAAMQQRGYTQVAASSNPDLAVNVNRIYNTSTGIIRYDNYWNNYGGYYDPYYYGYGGYGYYSPYSYATYTVREGALSIDILDLKNAASSNRITGIWSGVIRGSGIFNSATASSQVNMLFAQSPYLQKNQ